MRSYSWPTMILHCGTAEGPDHRKLVPCAIYWFKFPTTAPINIPKRYDAGDTRLHTRKTTTAMATAFRGLYHSHYGTLCNNMVSPAHLPPSTRKSTTAQHSPSHVSNTLVKVARKTSIPAPNGPKPPYPAPLSNPQSPQKSNPSPSPNPSPCNTRTLTETLPSRACLRTRHEAEPCYSCSPTPTCSE